MRFFNYPQFDIFGSPRIIQDPVWPDVVIITCLVVFVLMMAVLVFNATK